jgi:hypothetical protein
MTTRKRPGSKFLIRAYANAVPAALSPVYEVAPTLPGRGEKLRDREVSNAIAEWKSQHSGMKTR